MTERDHFLKKYGERWYLRDFDFYPEKLSDRVMLGDISAEFLDGAMSPNSTFKIFESELDALLACIKIRKMLQMDVNEDIISRTFKLLVEIIDYSIVDKAKFILDFLDNQKS